MCGHTQGHDEQLVVVHQQWNDWRTAQVRVGDLEDVRWFHPAGAPRPLIHAIVDCRSLVVSHLPHACDEQTAHHLEVCILKCHTAPCVFQDLALRATARVAVATGTGTTQARPTQSAASPLVESSTV